MTGTALSGRKYKAYPEYKESTIDWLDKIPVNWETKRLKHLGQAIIGLTYSPDEIVEEKEESSTLVLRSSNVQSQKIAFDDNVFVNKEIPERLRTQINDILICSRNGSRALIGKNALIDAQSVDMSFGAFMTIFRSEYNKYLSHVMNSKLFEYQSGSFLTSTINQLTTGNLNSFEIPFPTRSERDSIANFLDHETAKIDTLIAKQEKLIELLKEKRQAVISHAVTKGLNPNAPMRDSGVEWLGEVPEHWGLKQLKHFGVIIGGFAFKSSDFTDKGYPVIKISNVSHLTIDWSERSYLPEGFATEHQDYIAPKGALIFAMTRPIISGGIKVFLMEDDSSPLINQRVGFMKTNDENTSRFILMSSLSNSFLAQFTNNMTVTNQPNISGEGIGSIRIPLPPTGELAQINNYLSHLDKTYTKAIDKCNHQITLLKERKTALISAAVTGKIDVRDWKPQGV